MKEIMESKHDRTMENTKATIKFSGVEGAEPPFANMQNHENDKSDGHDEQ